MPQSKLEEPNERQLVHIFEGKKTFVPLENNPEVFTRLIHLLGISPRLTFHDVYSIIEPSLLALVPRPVIALIAIINSPVYHACRSSDPELADFQPYDGSGPNEPVLWFRQTIGHSCGLMSLVHAVANGAARQFVTPESPLAKLFEQAMDLKPEARAQLLYDSKELEAAHMEAAQKGDSVAPSPEDPNDCAFITFVKGRDGHLWQLEGFWKGPIDRGIMDNGEDLLDERYLDRTVRRFFKAAEVQGIQDLRFSLVALTVSESS